MANKRKLLVAKNKFNINFITNAKGFLEILAKRNVCFLRKQIKYE